MADDPDCLGLCQIDGDTCTGCGRTVDQIAAARGGGSAEDPPAEDPPENSRQRAFGIPRPA